MIKQFRDEHRWLSNFAPVTIKFNGIEYPSVEHAYMSAKSKDMVWKSKCADKQITAGQIKRESKEIELREDWDRVMKLKVMGQCLSLKFNEEPYRTLLENTGGQEIEEGNTWGDTFWGIDLKTGEGENNLGMIIMKIRRENRRFIHDEIIAKFMGYEYKKEKHYIELSNSSGEYYDHLIDDWEWFNKYNYPVDIHSFRDDWNILMTVVEKIESIKDKHHGFFGVFISSNGCAIQGTNLRTNIKQDPPVYFDDVTLNSKIESTYYCVVSFIQWYNKYLKNGN